MKDSDIIKALECCSTDGGCETCPAHGKGCELEKPALDLINRQKAEIEALKETIREHAEMLTERNAQIKMLQKENEAFAPLGKMYSEIKSEAIKEFIAEFERRCIEGGIYPAFVKRQLEHVKEEMVGE